MKKRFLVLAAVIFSSSSYAQDTIISKALDEVIVTANKFTQKQSSTGKVVEVIDQETLQRNAGKSVSEIINNKTGVFINGANNNLGTNQDIYFRGAGTGKTLILIDGIPVGDPSQINNGFDLNNIDLNTIERIEILKGSQSTLWGSDAVAGVINFITKKGGSDKIKSTVSLGYGSYNTIKGSASVNGKLGEFVYNLNYNLAHSKGFSSAYDSTGTHNFEKDKYVQNTVQTNVSYKFTNQFSIKGLLSYSKYVAGIDAGAFSDDKDNVINNKNVVSNLELLYTLRRFKLHISQSFIKAMRILTDDSLHVGGFAKYAKGNYAGNSSVTEIFANTILSPRLSLISGLQNISQNTHQDYMSISAYGTYKTALGDSAKANNYSLYNSLLYTGRYFNFEAGARINKHSVYGTNATYTLNPSFNIDENTQIFINVSSAYKIPSLYELYSEYGNKALKPETSVTYEAGFQTFSNNKKNLLRIVGFKRDLKQLIIFKTDPLTFVSKYVNRDRQHDYGFEMESKLFIGRRTSWENNSTFVDGEGENNNIKIKNLFRRPNFTLNSILLLQPSSKITVSPSFRFVGARLKGPYDAGPSVMPSYYTVDCYGGFEIRKGLKCYIDFRNITNQKYFDVIGYNSKLFNVMAGCIIIL